MKGFYFVVVLCAVVCTVWSKAESQGYDFEEWKKCLDYLENLSDVDDSLFLSTDGQHRWCRNAIPAMQCMETHVERYMNEEVTYVIHSYLIKIKEMYKILCDPGHSQEVWSEAESQDCVYEKMIKCLGYLNVLEDEDESFFLGIEEQERWCRDVNRALQCYERDLLPCMEKEDRYFFHSQLIKTKQPYKVLCDSGPHQEVLSEAELQGCLLNDVRKCLDYFEDLKNDDESVFLSTEGKERWCRGANQGLQCLESYVQRCMKGEFRNLVFRDLIKQKPYYKKFCDPGPQQEVSSEAESQGCVIKEMVKCLDYFQVLTDEDENFFLSKEGLDRWCRDMNRGLQCVESYVQRCMKGEDSYHFYSKIIRTKELMKNRCEPGPLQEEFLLHAPCLSQLNYDYVNFLLKYVQKVVEFQAKLKDPYSRLSNEIYSGTDSAMRIACCILRYFVVGIQWITMEKCGEKTAKYIEDVLIQIFDEPTIEGGCSSYLHGPDQCQGAFDNWDF